MDKRRQKNTFDPERDYVEDMDEFSRLTTLTLFPFDPNWYKPMIYLIPFEVLIRCYLCLAYSATGYSTLILHLRDAMFMYNLLYGIGSLMSLVVYYSQSEYVETELNWGPKIIIFCDILSTIPFNVIVEMVIPRVGNLECLGMLNTLKIIRLAFYINQKRRNINSFPMHILSLACIIGICICYMTIIFHALYCLKEECKYSEAEASDFFLKMMRRTTSKWTSFYDPIEILKIPYLTYEVYIIYWDLCLFLVTRLTYCHMIISMIFRYKHKFEYVHMVSYFSNQTAKKFKMSQEHYDIIMNFFKIEWEYRRGFSSDFERYNIAGLLPHSLLNEISMDYSWTFFQHSLLFRNTDIYLLKQLTSFVKKTLLVSGEYIYHKHDMKNQMIYIVNGIIEVLSNENCESGVLLLTAGSCLGEVNLVSPYESNCHFRCKTTAEIYTLDRRHFLETVKHYTNDFRLLQRTISLRFRTARSLMQVKFESLHHNSDGVRNLLFLKNNLHRLLSKNSEQFREHAMENIYLTADLNFEKELQPWNTKKYMELLVICGRRAAKRNLVFFKSNCLWILKPDSPLIHVWEYFIVAFAIFVALFLPYFGCINRDNSWNEAFMTIYVIWVIDFCILLITPVSIESDARTVCAIFAEKIHNVGFILDLLCVVPPIIFKCYMPRGLLKLSHNWIFLNQTLKVHRIFRLLNRWEKYFYVNILWHTIVKYLLFYFLAIYYLSCIIYVFDIDQYVLSVSSIQLAIGNAYLYDEVKEIMKQYFPIFAISDFVIYCLEYLATVSLIAAIYLNNHTQKKISEYIRKIWVCAKHYKINDDTESRLEGFLRTQKNDNQGIHIVHNLVSYYNFSDYYKSIIKVNIVPDLLMQIDALRILPKRYIMELSKFCVIDTYHKHCIIVGKGIVYKKIFVAIKGSTKTIIGTTVHPGRHFQMLNIFEICNEMPAVFSTIAMTEVGVLSFDFTIFKNVLKDNQMLMKFFFDNIRSSEYVDVLNRISLLPTPIITVTNTDEAGSVFLFTQEALSVSPFRFDDFHRPYRKLKPFGFIFRIFLLRRTINPNQNFMFYWECLRCVCAFLSSIVFINPVFNNYNVQQTNWVLVMWVLDGAAWLDIYVRLHVCYYNEDGILVKHPLSTAKYYLLHGFLVDVVGILPINYMTSFWGMSIQHSILISSFRLLPLYRVFGFKQHFLWQSNRVNVVFVLGTLVCGINYCCAIALANDCAYMQYDDDLLLGCESLTGGDEWEVFSNIFYVMTSTMTTVLISTVHVLDYTFSMKYIISIVCVLGFMWKIFTIGYLFSNHCLNDAEINFQRKSINGLLHLMRKEKVSVYLQNEVTKYFNVYWSIMEAGHPIELFQYLNVTLKRDLIYEIYGENLVAYSTFDENSYVIKTFYKNCLLLVKAISFPVGGYILTINDVHSNIYIVDKGYVEVIAADGTLLDVLGPGSLFGILENVKYQRQKVSIAACTIVQVLYLESQLFYKIIEYFPTIKKNFLEKRFHRMYYIASKAPKMQKRDPDKYLYGKAMARYRLFQRFVGFHSFICCFFGILLELYQIGVYELSIYFLLAQYFCDVIHIVYVIVYHFVGYMDIDGILVFDPAVLRKRNLRKKRLFFFVLTSLPVDLPLLLFFYGKPATEFAYLFVILRLNRLLRVCFRFWRQHYMMKMYLLTHGDSVYKKMARLWCLVMLFLFSTSAMLIVLDRTFGNGLCSVRRDVVKKWITQLAIAPPADSFDIFFKYLMLSKMLFLLKSDEDYYPANATIQHIYVFFMIYAYMFNIMIFGLFFDMLVEYLCKYMYFTKNINFFNNYKQKHVSNFIRKQLDNQLKMLYNARYPHYFILNTNSPNYLNETIRFSIYGYLFKHHKLFQKAHVDFVRQLLRHCRICYYPPRSLICDKQDDRDCMYFIHKGKVVVLQEEDDFVDMAVEVLSKGMSFGITQGIFSSSTTRNVFRAVNQCLVLELRLSDWKYLLDFFPATKQHIISTAKNLEEQYYS